METAVPLTIVIPAYNEAENLKIVLPDLLELCEQHNWKIMITNDGSKDDTRNVLQSFAANPRCRWCTTS